ncbi:MAG TPA: 50S ribosomal protein L10 [Flexilinea sp.]|nr:50S ribosomal protein L10 [Flexilinea sp.]OQA25763.1 MAG: 50S ribosomal protein L10 [Chloroflexi bacterium ADurb.Bin344]HNY20098.1 50S ribosomal protein L10 [Flexilinea sp.]HOG22148.1 50S ribosomal protein L10 [Flexilinea sp.]HOG60801.1 50S ribosomal protein L10 [Flexilinea sp.]
MAFTKSEKQKMMEQYSQWLQKSQGVFMLEYSKMDMPAIDEIRAKAREAGGEVHVVKDTLIQKVLEKENYKLQKDITGTSLVGFAFTDAAAMAKVFSDLVKNEAFKIKGGFLDKNEISESQVKALASLPPLPVMRAKLLGTILAPASQLTRVIAEPGRSLAAVIQAHISKEEPTAA